MLRRLTSNSIVPVQCTQIARQSACNVVAQCCSRSLLGGKPREQTNEATDKTNKRSGKTALRCYQSRPVLIRQSSPSLTKMALPIHTVLVLFSQVLIWGLFPNPREHTVVTKSDVPQLRPNWAEFGQLLPKSARFGKMSTNVDRSRLNLDRIRPNLDRC